MLWHPKTRQNLAMYNVFFIFGRFFHCRKATKMTQNSISIPSCAQTPKNPRKMSKTPPYSGLGAKPFLAPPAKADIATAILTNVIEHLVLLFCPPISTPSPPERCGRIYIWGRVKNRHRIFHIHSPSIGILMRWEKSSSASLPMHWVWQAWVCMYHL